MKITVLSVIIFGFPLLSGVGVDSQRTLSIGIPGTRALVNLEEFIYDALLGGHAFFNFGRNILLNLANLAPNGNLGNPFSELGSSIKGLSTAVMNLLSGNTRILGQLFLRLWHMVNTVIASTLRGIIRVIVDVLIGLKSGQFLDRLKHRPLKITNILKGLHRPRLLILRNRPLSQLIPLLISSFQRFSLRIETFITNRLQNAVNDLINRMKRAVRELPINLVKTALSLGGGLRNRPRLFQRLSDHLRAAMKDARTRFMRRMVEVRRVIFSIIGGLIRLLLDVLNRIGFRLRTGLMEALRTLVNSLGKIGDKLSRRGPMRMIIGIILQIIANRIKLIINTINSIIDGLGGVIRGIFTIVKNIIIRRLSFLWQSTFANIVARNVVRNNRIIDLILRLIPRPGKQILSLLPQLVKSGHARRMERRRKLLDALTSLSSILRNNLPRPFKIIMNRIRTFISMRPFKGATNVVVTIWRDLREILRGFVRILEQILSSYRPGGSIIIKLIKQLFSAGKRTPLTKIISIINVITGIIQRFTGAGGITKFITGVISALLYVFEPFLHS